MKKIILLLILITLVFAGCNRDVYNAEKIKFSDADITVKGDSGVQVQENAAIITHGGYYKLSGMGRDVQVIIDCAQPVTLFLDGLDLVNAQTILINIVSKGVVTIETIGEEENRIAAVGEEKITCIKSNGILNFQGESTIYIEGHTCIKSDDVINIDAALNISATGDGIKAKAINISGGNIDIVSGKDGIQAEDLLISGGNILISGTGDKSRGLYSTGNINITDGRIVIDTADDGIYAKNDFKIDGGNITINTQDDAVHAANYIEINGGNIIVDSCLEGIESGLIVINDGMLAIHSDNDGINAAYDDKDSSEPADVYINGGEIKIDADGDGVDANGSIFLNGGALYVSGAYGGNNNAIDFDDEFIINGGVIIAAGNNLNAKPPSPKGSQSSVMLIFDDVTDATKAFILTDEYSAVLFAADFPKPYDCIILSSADFINGKTYFYGSGQITDEENDYLINPTAFDAAFTQQGSLIINAGVTLVRQHD